MVPALLPPLLPMNALAVVPMEIVPTVTTNVGVSMEVEHLVLPSAPRVGTDDDPILTEEQFAQLEIESEVNGAFSMPL